MAEPDPSSKRYLVVALALLTLASVIPFLPMLGNQFVWDDHEFIINNSALRRIFPLSHFFSPQGLVTTGDIYPATGSRPLMTLSLALDHAVWGVNPFGYHLTNLILHVLCVLAVFGVVRLIARRSRTAFFAGLMFAVMPGHAEAVIAFLGRSDLLATLFTLLGLWSYIKARDHPRFSFTWYITAVVLIAAACLSKESGLVGIGLIAAAEFLFTWPGHGSLKTRLTRLLPLAAIGFGYVIYRGWVLKGNTAGLEWWGGNPLSNALMMFETIPIYLNLIIWPVGLSPMHSVPFPKWFSPLLMAGMLLTIALVAGCVLLVRKNRTLGFFALTAFLGFLPVANFLPIPGMIMAERWLYLPSVGLCGLAGWLVTRWSIGSAGHKRLVYAAVGLLCALYGLRIWTWCPVWHSDEIVARAALKTSPHSPVALNNLGKALLLRGRVVDAEAKFRQALAYKPDYGVAHFNLAMALRDQGRMEEARAECYEAVEFSPYNAEAHSNLAVVLWRMGDRAVAFEHFREAIRLNPDNEKFHYNFGLALDQAGLLDEALAEFRIVTDLDPRNVDAYLFIGYALGVKGQYQDAETVLRDVLKGHPDLAEAHYNLATALEKQERIPEAVAEYETYLRIAPNAGNRRSVEEKILKLKSGLSPH